MKKPTLLVLAAGMGSRFGGLKQIEPLGPNGEIIIDYSLYDACEAGFGRVVFVVKPELLETFKEVVGKRAERLMEVDYALQDVSMIPQGVLCPQGRQKPWGTGHAVWCARDKIDGAFGVVNADDFYGRDAYMRLGAFLAGKADGRNMCMVGFPLENTLTENGTVSRGICDVRLDLLHSVTERTGIARKEGVITYDEGGKAVPLPSYSVASMNVWGLHSSIFKPMGDSFKEFLCGLSGEGLLKGEFYLPTFIDSLIKRQEASVSVLATDSKWYGVTYREDKARVSSALRDMHAMGQYPKLT